MVDSGDRILPDEFLGRHQWAEIAAARAHVAVSQLVPCPSKGIRELIWVLIKASGNFFVKGIEAQGQVRG